MHGSMWGEGGGVEFSSLGGGGGSFPCAPSLDFSLPMEQALHHGTSAICHYGENQKVLYSHNS